MRVSFVTVGLCSKLVVEPSFSAVHRNGGQSGD